MVTWNHETYETEAEMNEMVNTKFKINKLLFTMIRVNY